MTETAPGGPAQSTAQTEDALLTALADIRAHWPALLHAGGSSSIAGKPTPRSLYTRDDHDERDDDLPPIDRRVSLSQEVTGCLNGWARIVVEDRSLTHGLPRGTDTLGLVALLERHARWFSGHVAAQDAVGELRAYAHKIVATVAPQRREWLLLGSCPLEVEVDGACRCHPRDDDSGHCLPKRVMQVCGGQVRAYPGRLPHCHGCGTEGPRGWWEHAMFPEVEVTDLVDAEGVVVLVQRAFGGKRARPDVVRQWVRRYGLTVHPGEGGRSLYDRAEVVRVLSERMEGTA